MAGRRLQTNAIEEVRLNTCYKTNVLEKLGPPAAIWEDERIFVYWWDVLGWKVYWAVAGTTGGTGGRCDVPQRYVTYVQFDEGDKVQRIERCAMPRQLVGPQMIKWARNGETPRSAPGPSARKKAVVLFRVSVTAEYKPLEESIGGRFGNSSVVGSRGMIAGLGTFDTAGTPRLWEPKKTEPGWFHHELEPGTHYITLQAHHTYLSDFTRSLESGAILRVDVPADAPLVYAGTVRLQCGLTGGGSDGKGRRSAANVNASAVTVDNETAEARCVASRLKPGDPVTTHLMTAHRGPYVLRTPPGVSGE